MGGQYHARLMCPQMSDRANKELNYHALRMRHNKFCILIAHTTLYK
jgi:hypothetical protein